MLFQRMRLLFFIDCCCCLAFAASASDYYIFSAEREFSLHFAMPRLHARFAIIFTITLISLHYHCLFAIFAFFIFSMHYCFLSSDYIEAAALSFLS